MAASSALARRVTATIASLPPAPALPHAASFAVATSAIAELSALFGSSSPAPEAIWAFVRVAACTTGSASATSTMICATTVLATTACSSSASSPTIVTSGSAHASRPDSLGFRGPTAIPSVAVAKERLTHAPLKSSLKLPPPLYSSRRYGSTWAWTPWDPVMPKEKTRPHPKTVEDVVQFLSEVNLSGRDEERLKKVFFERFYAKKTWDPSTVEMKIDFLISQQASFMEDIKYLAAEVKKRKLGWGTFMLFGKELDLTKIVGLGGVIGALFG